MTTRAISDIKIGKRHRREMGDIDSLASSIEDIGLLHPVVVTPDGKLIAGERRLEAAKALGWIKVPVHVVNVDAIARGELVENTDRKNFTPSELVAITATIEKRERELAKQRMTLGKVSTGSGAGKTRDKVDKVAAPLGASGRTIEKARAIVAAAKAEPERFGNLVAEMDRTGKVNAAHRALRRTQDEKRVLGLVPAPGRYRTLVIDPPWQYDMDFLGRGRPDYETMTHERLRALPVPEWAEDDCHLYLWTTNAMVPRAVELLAHYGFRHNTVLTWAKPHYGLGTHFRGQTEHVLFGIRGTLAVRRGDISTLFEAPAGAHSEKPDKFYEIVRAASYPPFGEAFQRRARPDFANLFTPESGVGDEEAPTAAA
jgi:N6-adenosine-specific RNA methylase IME4/ParB-like chromosome segregation protein Spo0J